MIVAESRRGRRLVGRLDKGTDLLEGLAEVCRARDVRAGEVRAIGSVDQVVLAEYDQRARQYRPTRRFDAQFEIVSLSGNVSEKDGKLFVHAHIGLSRERDNGIELIGGHMISGRVYAVEFVIEVFDDLILRRAADAQTGLSLWREAITIDAPAGAAAHVPFEAPARTSWQDVVAASTPTARRRAGGARARARRGAADAARFARRGAAGGGGSDRSSQVRPLRGRAQRRRVRLGAAAQSAAHPTVARRVDAGPGGRGRRKAAVPRRHGRMKKVVAVCDALLALALVAWVGGHAALGAFAARIVFRDLPRSMAASTMSTVFTSFDSLIGVAACIVLAATLARWVALRGASTRADTVVTVAAGFLICIGLFEVTWLNRQIVEMFHAGRTLEPSFAALHKISERCGHLEVVLTAAVLGGQAWSRVKA